MSDSETLCTSCGLCCDGTLFEIVLLEPAEVEKSRRLSLRVIPASDGRMSIKQPCSAFDGKCTVYADRPGPCVAFRCRLLTRVEAGEVPLPNALELVTRTRKHARQLAAVLPPEDPADRIPVKVRAWEQHQKEELPQDALRDLLHLTMLSAQHF